MSIVNSRWKFVFIHIPRTAGRSMTGTLRELPGHEKELCGPAHESAKKARERLGPDFADYTFWAVSRDEIERLESAKGYLEHRFGHVPEDVHQTRSLDSFIDEETRLIDFDKLPQSFEELMEEFGFEGVELKRLTPPKR